MHGKTLYLLGGAAERQSQGCRWLELRELCQLSQVPLWGLVFRLSEPESSQGGLFYKLFLNKLAKNPDPHKKRE